MDKSHILDNLVSMSRTLGNPGFNLLILGEGNTSARCDGRSFFIKASGTGLAAITGDQFVEVSTAKILTLLDRQEADLETVGRIYNEAKIDAAGNRLRPSVETVFHAVCLSFEGINYVGHTHATYVNMLTCSKNYPEVLKGRMYPDEIVVLGTASVFIPYISPGVPLAIAIKQRIDAFNREHNCLPKIIYLQNHGMIALGATAREVINITLTAEKAAHVRLGAAANGGINFLDQDTVYRIANRPDEKFREKLLKGE